MQKRIFAISLILLLGAFLRYAFLDWGKPFFFNPDENNIATAISQLSFKQWNPHFFAYGSLPMYVTFFLSQLIEFGKPSFAIIVYTLRFLSATFSFLIILSLFFIGKQVFNKWTGFIAALFALFGTGFIQYAHFGTFEMWLTFFTLWFFYFCYILWKNQTLTYILIVSFLGGILLAIKISSLALFPIPIFILLLRKWQNIKKLLSMVCVYSSIVITIYILTNPFTFLTPTDVVHALSYEAAVAFGTIPVFYTQSFIHTIPVLYQLLYVFPFLLNPFVFIFFLLGVFFLIRRVVNKPTIKDLFLLLFFLIVVFSQAFFYVKWSRYMVPSLPFVYLITATFLQKIEKRLAIILTTILLLTSIVYAFSFFFTVYPIDSRIAAASFVKQHITSSRAILEPYDLGILPFYRVFPHQIIINLYDRDAFLPHNNNLRAALKKNTIFVSLSQRLMKTRLKNSKDFPNGYALYQTLLDKKKFRIIYKTPCNLWCTILYNGSPLYNIEETASVFDHPFVTIFKEI